MKNTKDFRKERKGMMITFLNLVFSFVSFVVKKQEYKMICNLFVYLPCNAGSVKSAAKREKSRLQRENTVYCFSKIYC